MTRDRFLQIKKFLYFSEADEEIKTSKSVHKIKKVYDHMQESFKKLWLGDNSLIIDESMIAFTGNHSGKSYIPGKPTPCGFKIYVLTDSYGYAL